MLDGVLRGTSSITGEYLRRVCAMLGRFDARAIRELAAATGAVADPVDMPALDYSKVRDELLTACIGDGGGIRGGDRACLLLQALRLRLRMAKGHSRRRVLASYISNDVLDFGNGASLTQGLLECVFPLVREYVMRLINVIASDCVGRSYLVACPGLLAVRNAWLLQPTITALPEPRPS